MPRKHFNGPLPGVLLSALMLLAVTGLAAADDGYLGVQTQRLNEALMEAFELDADAGGVLVNEVIDGSPADEAGLKRGDLITAIDGKTLATPEQLRRRIRSFDAGETVAVDIVRRGETMSLEVELGELDRDVAMGDRFFWRGGDGSHHGRVFELDDSEDGPSIFFLNDDARPMLGVSLHELDEKLGEYFESDSGMLVLSVREDSPAEEAGVESGDVIVEADGEEIEEIEDLYDVLDEHEAGDTIELTVVRKGRSQTLEVGLAEGEHATRVLDELGSLHERFSGPGMKHFEFRTPRGPHRRGAPRMERFRLHGDQKDELQELREELKALREELEALKGN